MRLTGRCHGIATSFILASVLAACANTPGNIRPATTAAPVADVRFKPTDSVRVRVTSASDVSMADYEKQRVESRVREKIDALKVKTEKSGDAATYRVDVQVTKYEKGNAFARALLAGLGAMQIEATVRIYTLPAEKLLAEFTVDKTFAWGGIYGASTSMEDVEQGFAQAIGEGTTGPPAK